MDKSDLRSHREPTGGKEKLVGVKAKALLAPPLLEEPPDATDTSDVTYDLKHLKVLPVVVQDEIEIIDTQDLIGKDSAKNRRANQLLKQLKEPTAEQLVNLGCSYAYLHRFDEAEKAFKRAMATSDASDKAYKAAEFNLRLVLPDLRCLYPSSWSRLLSFVMNTMSNSWPLLIIGIGLILVLVGRGLFPEPPGAGEGKVPLPIKVSDLAGGTDLFELRNYLVKGDEKGDEKSDKYVSLVIVHESGQEGEKEFETASYPNLQVIRLLSDKGLSVENTGATPDSILLSVPADKFDAIVKRLQQEKKVAYLLPQGTSTVPPTATPAVMSIEYDEQSLLTIKVSDLASGANLFEPDKYWNQSNKYVRLVIVSESGTDDDKEMEAISYYDLQVLDLLDANGRSIVNTDAVPDSIVFSVPAGHLDNILKGWPDKKAAHLLPQGMATVPPTATPAVTPTPEPTSTMPADKVAFSLPTDKIQSDLKSLELGSKVVVIAVVERKDAEGEIVEHEAHRHDDATLLDVLDADGVPLDQPYKDAATVRISLPLGTNDGPAVEFAAHLADANALYLVKEK